MEVGVSGKYIPMDIGFTGIEREVASQEQGHVNNALTGKERRRFGIAFTSLIEPTCRPLQISGWNRVRFNWSQNRTVSR